MRRRPVTALCALVIAATGCANPSPADEPGSRAEPDGAATGVPSAALGTGTARPARRVRSAPATEAPATLRLPSGDDVAVTAVSTRAGGVLDVPDDVERAGWWRGGSRLGDPFGATLIAGHVDSATQGLGVFASLLSVRPGQRATVRTERLTQTFTIRSLELVPRTRIGTRAEIYSVRGRRRLVLVTCAPPYDPAGGGYRNLAVATAYPDGPVRTRENRHD